jgi:hypothetical protein
MMCLAFATKRTEPSEDDQESGCRKLAESHFNTVVVVILLGSQAWDAWSRLKENQRAEQVVAAYRQIFTALINQRTDRSTTQRLWDAEGPPTEQNKAYLADLRGHEMPALVAGTALLESLSFAGRDTLLPELKRATASLTALQAEFDTGINRPWAERRTTLGAAYRTEGLALQAVLQQSPPACLPASRMAIP